MFPTEQCTYDLFISYSNADRAWVNGYLLDALSQAGVRLHTKGDFVIGAPILTEYERAVQQSAYTLLVLTPAYMADHFSQFVDILVQSYGLESATWPVIPLILKQVDLPPRLALLSALDATDVTGWDQVVGRLCGILHRDPPESVFRPPCPYPGMRAFSEQELEHFYGRDNEIQALVEQLRLHPFTTVIGPSGSGKSSLIFAGLIPALRKSNFFREGAWAVCDLRPSEHPLTTLTQLLQVQQFQEFQIETFLATKSGASHLLLVVDQFEELFTLPSKETDAFVEALQSLMHTDRCYIVMAVRADFYAELMASPLWPEIQHHRLELAPLDEDKLRRAITKPAESVGVFIESALVERLIADAAGEPGVLPFVQEVLVLLWEKLERRYLPLRAYEALVLPYSAYAGPARSGLQIAIANRADAVLAELPAEQQVIAQRIFLRLIQFGEGRANTRRQQSVDALRSMDEDPQRFEQTLHYLIGSRLLTVSSQPTADRKVDISHEAMIKGWPTLNNWIQQQRAAEQMRRRLEAKAAEWQRLGRGKGGLLDEVELAEACAWITGADAHDLGYSAALVDLLEESSVSIKSTTAKQRRFWLTTAGLLVVLILLITFAILEFSPVQTGWQRMETFDQFIDTTTEPSQIVVAVNTRDEMNIYVTTQRAGGLYRTTDGGRSWQRVTQERMTDMAVYDVSASQDTVYATSSVNVYISRNRGNAWILGNLKLNTELGQRPWSVAIDPDNPEKAYIGTQNAGLLVTTDGGSTWLKLDINGVQGQWIRTLTISQKNIVLATELGVWLSQDNGKSWHAFIGDPLLPSPVLDLTFFGTRGRFLLALGNQMIGDADISSSLWFSLPDAPPGSFISSVSTSEHGLVAVGAQGLLCNYTWTWQQLNWWYARLGLAVPCLMD